LSDNILYQTEAEGKKAI